jgi:hypothetical protein
MLDAILLVVAHHLKMKLSPLALATNEKTLIEKKIHWSLNDVWHFVRDIAV